MKVDTVITLSNGANYLLLLESSLELVGYFLAVRIDENNEPTKDYAVLQEIENGDDIAVKKINDPIILNQLLEDYQLQYEDDYEQDDEEA